MSNKKNAYYKVYIVQILIYIYDIDGIDIVNNNETKKGVFVFFFVVLVFCVLFCIFWGFCD